MDSQVRLRSVSSRTLQQGQAAIILLLLVGLGVIALVYGMATPAKESIERDKKTAAALAQARDALIGRAATDNSIPGSLPCPDTDNDGSAELFAGNSCPSYIGRLPWRTLGLPDLRDGSGERLWYALSSNFRDHPLVQPLNSDTAGQLTITGSAAAANVIAIVFSPGSVVGAQLRNAANENNVANYLEGENANGDTVYTAALASDTFNDNLLPITSDALFNVVNIRVAKEAIAALETYRALNNYYPFANPYGSLPPYNCSNGLNRGRIPITPTGCGQAAWPGSAPVWFANNNWNLVTHYAFSKACGQLGLPLGLDALVMGACDLLGNLSGVLGIIDPALILLGLPPLSDDPVTVTGVSNNVRVLVVVTGRAQGVQVHPCASAAQCMEDAQNTDGNGTYVKPSRFPTSNDRMALTCATNSPCNVLP
jgi:hypothetical protein